MEAERAARVLQIEEKACAEMRQVREWQQLTTGVVAGEAAQAEEALLSERSAARSGAQAREVDGEFCEIMEFIWRKA